MTRSVWKGIYVDPKLAKLKRKNLRKTKYIIVYKRSSTILKNYVGFYAKIYNGKDFKTRKITSNMIGFKFGEFAPTTPIGSKYFEKDKQKQKTKKKK